METNLISLISSKQVNELISDGWEFTLHYGDHSTYCDIKEPSWECDFTRKGDDGLWDNHECGYGHSPESAIEKAYQNIKNGVRLIRNKTK